jgi:hypothetical protein
MPSVMVLFALLSLRLCCVGVMVRLQWRNTMQRGNTPAELNAKPTSMRMGIGDHHVQALTLYALRHLNNTKIWLLLYEINALYCMSRRLN